MAATAAKHYHINVIINLKRTKEEVNYADKETDRLHNLIGSNTQVEWAQERIEKLHEMVLMPSAKQLKNDLVEKLKDEEALEAASVEAEADRDGD